MSFDNSSFVRQSNNSNNTIHNISRTVSKAPAVISKNIFNTPMVDRIYKAKPGCSACGKKVA
jgi:hypothetical protein